MARLAVIILIIAIIVVLLRMRSDPPPVSQGPSGNATAKGTIASYRGSASIVVQGIRQHIPVEVGISAWSGGAFTGFITIRAARTVTVPINGRYTDGNISGVGVASDGSLTISIRATRLGESILGTYQATIENYMQYYLDSRLVSGDISLSLVTAHNVAPLAHSSQVCTLSFTATAGGAGRAIFYNVGRGDSQKIRAEIEVRSMNATDIEYTIVKSGTTYRWKNNERRGCKFANAPVSFIEYFGLEDYQLSCQIWHPDETKFAVPKGVYFTFLERPDITPCVQQ